MANAEKFNASSKADSYIDALDVTCAWLAMEIRCAMYNLKRDAVIPDEICRRVGCKALISSAPRPEKKHLAEAAIRAGEPNCDLRKQNRRVRSDAKPAFPRTPKEIINKVSKAEASASQPTTKAPGKVGRSKAKPEVTQKASQEPPEGIPEMLPEEAPHMTPDETSAGPTPWVNPFPRKPRPAPEPHTDQTISNNQLWSATQPPPEME